MDQQQSDYTIRDLVQSLHGATECFFELIAPALGQDRPAVQAVEDGSTVVTPIYPFAEEVGEAVATLSQNFFDFFETMQVVYDRQRGNTRHRVPTRDALVFDLFERWRMTGGPVGNAETQKQKIIAELEALFAPVVEACEYEPKNVAAESKAWLMLDSNITDVLRIAMPDESQSMQMYATARLIMKLIERYLAD